jgi:hypothetical protein
MGYIEKWFAFALIWSVCCTVDEASRKEMDNALREVEPLWGPSGTVFDYFIKLEKRDFVSWETELSS